MKIISANITGSLILNNVDISSITGSQTSINSLNSKTGSYATTGSNAFIGQQNINGSVAVTGSLTTTGTIVAQTLNVQQVTSSIIYSSGSNIFGNNLSNTQVMTGSVSITGSLNINGTGSIIGSGTVGTLPKFTAASVIGNSLFTDNGTNGGIGGANYSSGTNVRTFNISAPAYAGLTFWANNVMAADIFGYQLSGNLILSADPLNVLSASNLIFTVDGVTKLTIPSTGPVTFAAALSGTSATFSSGGLALKLTATALSTYGSTNYAQWYRADGTTPRAYVGYGSGNDQRFQITTQESGGSLEFSVGNNSVALAIASTGAATFSGALSGTSATFSNTITSTMGNNTLIFNAVSATTGYQYFNMQNTSGRLYMGIEGSTAAQLTIGNTAYSTTFGSVNATDLFLATNQTARLKIDGSTGAATFSSGISVGGATATTGGIQFPATAVAIADANNLDDYEEGTWTPGLSAGTSGTISVNTGNSKASYTKIGRAVTLQAYILVSSVSSPVGRLSVTGFPFTVGSNLGDAVTSVYNVGFTGNPGGWPILRVNPGTTGFIDIQEGDGTNPAIDLSDHITTGTELVFSMTYFV